MKHRLIKLNLALRSSLFFIGMVLFTIIYACLSLLTFPLPYRKRYRFILLWCHVIIHWLKLTCKLNYEILGLENIPNHNVIILSKHQSAWETFVLQILFPLQATVLKKELLRIPFYGWALALLEPIAIDRQQRSSAMEQIITQGKTRLAEGRSILIFPEGTRVAPGQHKRLTRGGATLAQASAYPILPIAHNAGEFWPRHGFIKYPGTIKLIIGPLISTQDKTVQEINQEVQTWMDVTMQQYFGYH